MILLSIFTEKDLSSFSTVVDAALIQSGAYFAFYAWKERVVNKKKIALAMAKEMLDQYGDKLDAGSLTMLIQSVIQD